MVKQPFRVDVVGKCEILQGVESVKFGQGQQRHVEEVFISGCVRSGQGVQVVADVKRIRCGPEFLHHHFCEGGGGILIYII